MISRTQARARKDEIPALRFAWLQWLMPVSEPAPVC